MTGEGSGRETGGEGDEIPLVGWEAREPLDAIGEVGRAEVIVLLLLLGAGPRLLETGRPLDTCGTAARLAKGKGAPGLVVPTDLLDPGEASPSGWRKFSTV